MLQSQGFNCFLVKMLAGLINKCTLSLESESENDFIQMLILISAFGTVQNDSLFFHLITIKCLKLAFQIKFAFKH